VAFKNYYDYIGVGIFFKFKCLEWLNVYGVEGSSIPEIEDKIEGMKKSWVIILLSTFLNRNS
jgi:transcriptional regulator, AsnC family